MLLSRLNDRQIKSFLALATKMAMADGGISDQEAALLEYLAKTYGHVHPVFAEEIFGATNVGPFESRESRVITIIGMLTVAYIDGNFHIDESLVLTETISAFGFSEDEVERMVALAKGQVNILNEFRLMVAMGETNS